MSKFKVASGKDIHGVETLWWVEDEWGNGGYGWFRSEQEAIAAAAKATEEAAKVAE